MFEGTRKRETLVLRGVAQVTVSREVALTAAGTTALASVCGSSSLTITSALGGAGSSVACQVVTLAAAGGAELPPVQVSSLVTQAGSRDSSHGWRPYP